VQPVSVYSPLLASNSGLGGVASSDRYLNVQLIRHPYEPRPYESRLLLLGSAKETARSATTSLPAAVAGRFGAYGGRYVPETLMAALEELERAYNDAKEDAAFQAELDDLLRNYCGRPTPLYFAKRLTEQCGGA